MIDFLSLTIERAIVVETVSKDKVNVLSKGLRTVILELYHILINLKDSLALFDK